MNITTRNTLTELAMLDLIDEIKRAYTKFPSTKGAHNDKALMEEVGELMKALLEQDLYDEVFSKLDGVIGPKPTNEDIYKEAIQVAVMAVRIAVEGVKGTKYKCPLLKSKKKYDTAIIRGRKGPSEVAIQPEKDEEIITDIADTY
jgi:hypothetical protein